MDKIRQLEQDIKSLKIQGATNVALATLEGLEIAGDFCKDIKELQTIGEKLAYARPAEPLAQNAIRFIFAKRERSTSYYLEKVKEYELLINDTKNKVRKEGISLIKNQAVYLTHCHSSTVVSMFIDAKKQGKNFAVIVTETRPLFQGRITVKELLKGGVEDVTLIIDNVASSIIISSEKHIDGIFIGADLLSEKGFVNKVGSLAIAYAAKRRNIPVYGFSILLKYDPRNYSPSIIEKREGSEIWQEAPPNLKFYTPAFDYVPYDTNIKIVCEKGIIPGKKVKEEALSLYPFLSTD